MRIAGAWREDGRRRRRVRRAEQNREEEEEKMLMGGPGEEKFIYFFFSLGCDSRPLLRFVSLMVRAILHRLYIGAKQVHPRNTLHALPPLGSAEIAQRLRSLRWVDYVLFVDLELLHVALEPLGAILKLPSSMYNRSR